MKKIYGKAMKVVLLYGSYARGDYNEKSDVDIMILVDMPDSVINQFFAQTADMTYDFNMDNHVEFSPAVKNIKQFYKWVEVNPFYKNVKKRGVSYMKLLDDKGDIADLVKYRLDVAKQD